MHQNANVVIRNYRPEDRDAVRSISCETAFLGNHELFFDDDEILADALTKYYTDYEPESCFVAEVSGGVVGYVIGAVSVARQETILRGGLYHTLLVKAWKRGVFFRGKILRFFLRIAVSAARGEFIAPRFDRAYPASLHINLREGFRGRDIGTQLVMHYLSYLRERIIAGVHFGTFSRGGKEFFEKTGFAVLFRGTRSFFRYQVGSDIPFYIMGKRL